MRKLPLFTFSILLFCAAAQAANWPTYQGDAQRSGWQREETALSTRTVKGLELLWKRRLENTSFGLNSLTTPTIVERVITHRGFQELVFIAGSSGKVYAVDADLGTLLWQRQLEASPDTRSSDSCGEGLTAAPVFNPVPSAAAAEDDDNDLSSLNPVYALSRAGKLFALRPINGADMVPPSPFLPPGGRASNPALFENFIYTTVSADCGRARSGVWAIDAMARGVSGSGSQQKKTRSYDNAGIGRSAITIAPDGTLLSVLRSSLGDLLLSIFPVNLIPKAFYTPLQGTLSPSVRSMDQITSPTVFDWKGKRLIAGLNSEGHPFLLQERTMKALKPGEKALAGGAQVRADQGQNTASQGGTATWQDATGTRWIYFALTGGGVGEEGGKDSRGVLAFKVVENHGQPSLEPSWTRVDIQAPSAPAVANGVVYVLSTGEFTGRARSTQERVARSRPAVLYALDAASGKPLFSSGKTVASFNHSSGLAVANGHVCFGTWDNTLYCFGLPIDF